MPCGLHAKQFIKFKYPKDPLKLRSDFHDIAFFHDIALSMISLFPWYCFSMLLLFPWYCFFHDIAFFMISFLHDITFSMISLFQWYCFHGKQYHGKNYIMEKAISWESQYHGKSNILEKLISWKRWYHGKSDIMGKVISWKRDIMEIWNLTLTSVDP